jgi:hypothetical protein
MYVLYIKRNNKEEKIAEVSKKLQNFSNSIWTFYGRKRDHSAQNSAAISTTASLPKNNGS